LPIAAAVTTVITPYTALPKTARANHRGVLADAVAHDAQAASQGG